MVSLREISARLNEPYHRVYQAWQNSRGDFYFAPQEKIGRTLLFDDGLLDVIKEQLSKIKKYKNARQDTVP